MKFIVSKTGFRANDDDSPGREVEILPGEKLAVLLKQYSPAKVRFSWKGQPYWAFKALFDEYPTPETEQDQL
jgi:hypothetical protein